MSEEQGAVLRCLIGPVNDIFVPAILFYMSILNGVKRQFNTWGSVSSYGSRISVCIHLWHFFVSNIQWGA